MEASGEANRHEGDIRIHLRVALGQTGVGSTADRLSSDRDRLPMVREIARRNWLRFSTKIVLTERAKCGRLRINSRLRGRAIFGDRSLAFFSP